MTSLLSLLVSSTIYCCKIIHFVHPQKKFGRKFTSEVIASRLIRKWWKHLLYFVCRETEYLPSKIMAETSYHHSSLVSDRLSPPSPSKQGSHPVVWMVRSVAIESTVSDPQSAPRERKTCTNRSSCFFFFPYVAHSRAKASCSSTSAFFSSAVSVCLYLSHCSPFLYILSSLRPCSSLPLAINFPVFPSVGVDLSGLRKGKKRWDLSGLRREIQGGRYVLHKANKKKKRALSAGVTGSLLNIK